MVVKEEDGTLMNPHRGLQSTKWSRNETSAGGYGLITDISAVENAQPAAETKHWQLFFLSQFNFNTLLVHLFSFAVILDDLHFSIFCRFHL